MAAKRMPSTFIVLQRKKKNTAISGVCGWWQLTNTAASCPVSLNFNFMLSQSMSVCLFLHHYLNPPPTICPSALVAFLSTILICLDSHLSTCTLLHYKNGTVRTEQSCSGKAADEEATSKALQHDTSQNQKVSQTGQSAHTVHAEINNMLLEHWWLCRAICAHGWSLLLKGYLIEHTGLSLTIPLWGFIPFL